MIEVRTDSGGFPAAIRECASRGLARDRRLTRQRPAAWLAVAEVKEFWKTEDEWWRGEDRRQERVYFDLVLTNGRSLQVFRDLVGGNWFRQSA